MILINVPIISKRQQHCSKTQFVTTVYVLNLSHNVSGTTILFSSISVIILIFLSLIFYLLSFIFDLLSFNFFILKCDLPYKQSKQFLFVKSHINSLFISEKRKTKNNHSSNRRFRLISSHQIAITTVMILITVLIISKRQPHRSSSSTVFGFFSISVIVLIFLSFYIKL